MKGGGQGPAGPPGCRAVSPSTPAAHRHSAIRTRQTPQISLHFAEPSPLTKSFAQCPPDGTLTDIIKLVQTQLVSFYVTLIHKDQLSKVFLSGGLGDIGSIGGAQFFTVQYQQKCGNSKKGHLVNKTQE